MALASSTFYTSNSVKTFSDNADGATIYASHVNAVQDEILGVQTVLGTGLRTRSVVTWATGTTSFTDLTSRLNNMDAGIRSQDVAIHPQYAIKAGTSLQAADTSTTALTVQQYPSSTANLINVANSANSANYLTLNTTSLTVNTASTFSSNLTVGGVVTINSTAGTVFNVNSSNFYINQDGSATTRANLNVAGRLQLTDFTLATHTHLSTATGGRVIPAGMLAPYAGPLTATAGAPSATIPSGWLLCDGSLVDRTTYSDLFLAIGTTYGTSTASNFALPNLKSNVIIGVNSAASFGATLGTTGGEQNHVLTSAEIPAHTHALDHNHPSTTSGSESADHSHGVTTYPLKAFDTTGGTKIIGADAPSSLGTGSSSANSAGRSATHTHAIDLPAFTGTSGSTGSGGGHNNLQPYIALNYIIKV
jgi:microcystin-dependent protein